MTAYKHWLPNLTPLRFFLALLVVVYHTHQFCKNRGFAYFDQWPILNKGSEAVFVFFILSGFLIIRALHQEKEIKNQISLKPFFIKRAFRILPLYYLVLFFGFFYYWILLPQLAFDTNTNYSFIKGFLLGFTMFANVLANDHPGGILEILWSIGIEEQFYFFIAPLLFFIPLKRHLQFLIAFTLVYYAMFHFNVFPIILKFKLYFFYFTIGGIVGIVFSNEKLVRLLAKIRYLVFTLIGIYFFTNLLKIEGTLYHLLSMILLSVFIWTLALYPIKILENKVLYLLGNASYGMYMLHAIVIQFVGFLFLKEFIVVTDFTTILLFNFLVIFITIVLSIISHRYFEAFFIKIRHRFY